MDFDLTNFSATGRQDFFDLLILAMYADGHLSTFEDERLRKFLVAMGHADEVDQQREFDAAMTRTRPFVESIPKARDQVLVLIKSFTLRAQHRQIFAAMEEFMLSDGHLTAGESDLLAEVRLKFKV